jgi:hypothetical protein
VAYCYQFLTKGNEVGFLNNLFGAGTKVQPTRLEDGKWLSTERDSDWKEVLSFPTNTGSQKIEVATESCYSNGKLNFCVLRSVDEAKSTCTYFGCSIPTGVDEEIFIMVDRTEKLNGEVVTKDDWNGAGRVLSESRTPGVSNAIRFIRNLTAFNSYSTMPPYVLLLLMGSR